MNGSATTRPSSGGQRGGRTPVKQAEEDRAVELGRLVEVSETADGCVVAGPGEAQLDRRYSRGDTAGGPTFCRAAQTRPALLCGQFVDGAHDAFLLVMTRASGS